MSGWAEHDRLTAERIARWYPDIDPAQLAERIAAARALDMIRDVDDRLVVVVERLCAAEDTLRIIEGMQDRLVARLKVRCADGR